MKTFHRASLGSLPAGGAAVLLTILLAVPAYATSDLNTVIDSVRNWDAGLLAALATLTTQSGSSIALLERRGRSRDVVEVEIAARLGWFRFDDGSAEPAL